MRFKLEGAQIASPTAANAASTVENGIEVSVYNNSTTAYLVTVLTAASGAVVGTITLGGGEREVIVKDRAHAIYAANAAVLLTSINTRV